MSREADINQAAQVLINAREEVLKILSGPEHSSLSLAVGPQMQQIINRLHFMSGTLHEVIAPMIPDYPPITNFMGEEIVVKKPVNTDLADPSLAEREKFRSRVESLYAEFRSLSPEGILNSYTTADDQLILRGVAKKAGVQGYEDKNLTVSFLEEIAQAIEEREAEEAEQKRIDKELDEKFGNGEKQPEVFIHTLTQEDLDENPDLVAEGLQVGDEIEVPVTEEDDQRMQKNLEEEKSKAGSKKSGKGK